MTFMARENIRMGLKELKLSVNETYDYGDYENQVKYCTDSLEGVYDYGCPGERSVNYLIMCKKAV